MTIAYPKTHRWRSGVYLDFVRGFDCFAPGCAAKAPSEAHHWHPTEKGTGRKPSDCFAVSLCARCHRHWHQHGRLPHCDPDESRQAFIVGQWVLLSAWVKGDTYEQRRRPGWEYGAQGQDPF